MEQLVKLLVLVVAMQCIVHAENTEEIQIQPYPQVVDQHPIHEESRFQKFLSLFGIGSTNQLDSRGDYSRAYQQYGYPCPIPTTTTPSPMPYLCPYPPMLPAQLNSQGNNGQGKIPSSLPPPPNMLGHLPPPPGASSIPPPPGTSSLVSPPPGAPWPHPAGVSSLPPPPSGTPPLLPPSNVSGSKPQSPLPGLVPQSPFPSPPHNYFPGKPDHLFPSPPPFPGQSITTPVPIQNLPQPVLPGQSGSSTPPLPAFPGPLYPSNIGPGQGADRPNDPSLLANFGAHPEQPIMVDPVNPQDPVKVNPIAAHTFDPVKVKPSFINPSNPLQVNPINFKPGSPMVIDPLHYGPPHFASPSNDQPFVVDPLHFMDDKGFSKHKPIISPSGSMNVLINPGIPDMPLPKPPNTTVEPVKELPPKFTQPLDPHLVNGLPINDGHIIGPFPGPLHPSQIGSNAVLIGPLLTNDLTQVPHHLGNNFFPPPPLSKPSSIPTTPSPPKVVPIPPVEAETVLPQKDSSQPTSAVHPLPPKLPEGATGPACGSPFLRPYVPPGFHFTSVNQFIGLPTVPSSRFVYPCPTADLLKALDFKIMRSLIISSGLLPLFEHTRNYTLFIPSDAAFRRLPRWFRDSLDVDKKLKKALVLNHLIKDDLPLDKLENEELVLTARPGGHRIRINIYQKDNTYRTITVDGSEVEKGDILTNTGRVHIVNKVIMPNLPRNAAQFLSEKLEFESFWNLIKQADLVETFQHPTPFTLFIPVNEAVQRLNDSTFFSDREKLRNFINYHVVNGTYYSNGIINNEFLLTNYEKEVKLQVVSDNFAKSLSSINGNVRILKSDITLTNGVAHVIDKCISEDTPFYVYPQSDEFKMEYGVMKRSFRVTSEEKNISNAF